MGNLKSRDFRVIGQWLLCAVPGVFVLAESAAIAAERINGLEYRSNTGLVQLAQSTSSDSVKNIQRLLTLLAERYKTKYGAVSPGRVDGSFGKETRTAIRKYQEISGIKLGSQTNEQLVSDILATLAQMSAEQPEELGDGDAEQVRIAPSQELPSPELKSTLDKSVEKPDVADDSATGTTKVPPASAGAAAPPRIRPTYTAPVPPAKVPVPAAVDQGTKSVSQRPRTTNNDRVYFTQLASLRTLKAAQSEWQRIFDANRTALNGEQIYFEQAEIAGRGTFHRILVGPIPEREAAKMLCGFLKQNDQPCVVVSRSLSTLRNLKDKNGKLMPLILPASGSGSTPSETTTVSDQPATETSHAGRNQSDAQTAAEAHPAPAPADVTSAASTANATAVAVGTAASGNPIDAAAPEKQRQNPGSPEILIAEASKIFADKRARTVPEIGAAGPTATVDVANPSIDAAPELQPSIPGLGPAGETSVTSRETPPAAAGTTPPTETVVEPPRALEDAKTATLVPFSESSETAPAQHDARQAAPTTVDIASPPGESATRDTRSQFGAFGNIRKLVGETRNRIGIIAAIVLGAAALVLLRWHRNRRKTSFVRLLQPGYSFGKPVSAGSGRANALMDLETDFESEQLRGSRSIRDEFLRDILGDDINHDEATVKKEPAIRVNSSLKSLLISNPAQYKSIFRNWIFLSKVGAALNEQEITMEDLNGQFGREFSLLQNYFKIHLLELDARHGIRKELPGLFYCLHIAQQRQRQAAGAA